MKSNEEYLDELLKAMEQDSSALPPAAGQEKEPPSFDGPDTGLAGRKLPEEEDAVEQILQSMEETEARLPEETKEEQSWMMSPEELLQSIEEAEAKLEKETKEEQPWMSPEELLSLMPEGMDNGQPLEEFDFEDDSFMTEEGIDALLNAAKANIQVEREDSFNLEEQEELAEINELLKQSGSTEFAEDAAPSFEDAAVSYEEAQEFTMEDLDSLLEDRSAPKQDGQEASPAPKEGKPSLLKRLIALFTEEEEEPESPAEAAATNLSEENRDILAQMDKESKAKLKADKKEKQEKKKKKSKAGGQEASGEEGGKKKKAKPGKEPKPRKEKKSKPEETGQPEKSIPRKKVIVTVLFAVSVMAAILLMERLLSPMLTLASARKAYAEGDYETALIGFYGEKLDEGDEEKYQTARAVMRLQTNLDSYWLYQGLGDELSALHYLLEGVHIKEDVYAAAAAYGAYEEVDKVYQEILGLLSSGYGLTEEAAMEIIGEKDDLAYTRRLQETIGE